MEDKVFFLGAGFSKSIYTSHPSLDELTKKIVAVFRDESSVASSLRDHFDTIPIGLHCNIEDMLTYLSCKLAWKKWTQESLDLALYIEMTNQIVCHFKSLKTDVQSNKDLGKLCSFIATYKTPIITLNYDLVVENILLSNEFKNFSLKQFYQIPIIPLKDRGNTADHLVNFTHNIVGKCPHILKLHGSANWLCSRDFPSNSLYFEEEKTDNTKEYELVFKDDLDPFIVPPVSIKDNFYNNSMLKILWIKAHKYLENAKEIYIIGFSFPLTDLSIKFLFLSALRNNKEVKIFVINTDTGKELKNRYSKIFSKKQIVWDFCKPGDPLNEFINGKLEI